MTFVLKFSSSQKKWKIMTTFEKNIAILFWSLLYYPIIIVLTAQKMAIKDDIYLLPMISWDI